ncbi:MAG: hypothetical protein MUE44_07090 [Oscillatoriaceae cyanobacterium Prado104]|nr:hypothetical protein [Oscillatoriaceae cyanobacterium Prado104]
MRKFRIAEYGKLVLANTNSTISAARRLKILTGWRPAVLKIAAVTLSRRKLSPCQKMLRSQFDIFWRAIVFLRAMEVRYHSSNS